MGQISELKAEFQFSCPDWVERLKSGKSLIPDLPLNKKEANRAVGMFNKLCLPDVIGTPTMEVAAGDWFRDIVGAVFGSCDKDNRRHVGEVFALVPKKNSKTTGGAGIMIVALLMNKRPRAEFLLIGPTQKIADLAFQQASGMIAADPAGYLQKRFQVHAHIKEIVDLDNGAVLKVMTFDMKVLTGSKATGILIDEVHILSKISYATNVIGQLRGGLLPRPDGFLIFITTQSDDAPAGVFLAELKFARAVRDGAITGRAARVLPVLYEFSEAVQTDPKKPWMDPAIWPWVLPNLGLSIQIEDLLADFEQSKLKGEEELRRWASQHLNIQIGLALHNDRWRGADYWLNAADKCLTLEELIERSEVATVGIDGGGLDDLLGLCVIGRCKETKQWLFWFHAWAQRDVLKLRKEIAEKLCDFERDGDLTFCDGGTEDIMGVADIVDQIYDAGLLPEKHAVGFDPQGVAAMVDELANRGIEGDMVVGIAQGFRLSSAVWGMERKLKDGTMKHDGSAMMNWCVGNAKPNQAGNGVLITKETAGKSKIDPLCAGFDAFKLMERNPVAHGNSIYRERGALVL
ncbi:terminase large subunit [Maritalea sp.]|uniref:terminase large subunit n=1 Tax=Maritalea sp. TaxID=2003361 RepID=UPI003EF7B182